MNGLGIFFLVLLALIFGTCSFGFIHWGGPDWPAAAVYGLLTILCIHWIRTLLSAERRSKAVPPQPGEEPDKDLWK